jgi:hypothetical protein
VYTLHRIKGLSILRVCPEASHDLCFRPK